MNLYAYVANDPLNATDPSGEMAHSLACGPGAAACAAATVAAKCASSAACRRAVVKGAKVTARAAVSVGNWIVGVFNDDKDKSESDVGLGEVEIGEDEEAIYVIDDPDATITGDDYVGRTGNPDRRRRDNSDGRDRTKAKVTDIVDAKDAKSVEQQRINDKGGVEFLDNKRNEVSPKRWDEYGIDKPN